MSFDRLSGKQMRKIWLKTESNMIRWEWVSEYRAECSDERFSYDHRGYFYLPDKSYPKTYNAHMIPFTLSVIRFKMFMARLKQTAFPPIEV